MTKLPDPQILANELRGMMWPGGNLPELTLPLAQQPAKFKMISASLDQIPE